MEFDLETLDIGLEVDGEELFDDEEREAVDIATGLNEASGGQEGEKTEQAANKKSRQKKNGKPFNEKLLCGENGIKALPGLFEGTSFRGKNEEENLNLLLRKYEFWAHQLYPRFPFADVVERVEELGAKKAVRRQAYAVKKGQGDDVDSNFDDDDNNNGDREGVSNLDVSRSRDHVHLG
eukprot:Seg3208.3 transcript_id=Seg3208.3/GoldUCD/mRNA.D3Y31 product="TIMELESS-interacting protein" protein_id=Seg3208.3/GoldUCD/D3Y31